MDERLQNAPWHTVGGVHYGMAYQWGANVLAYVLVNAMLVVIWYVTGAGFFWPIFPILGWGIGVVFHVWDVMSPGVDERQIQAEMDRLRGTGR